ncbi:MAG: hypothetical protein LC104_09775, partial [Bacteroidales bacterium]|nr:hypothetical protein [Bacteroidales bacterium]
MHHITTALVLLSLALPVHADGLSVGFGEADVTPDLQAGPVYLAGFGQDRPATKVHDPIMARAVVLSDGQKKITLVCVDVVGIFLPTVEAIRKQLPGFDAVIVSATHNHEGPDTLGLWGKSPFQSGVDPQYLRRLVAGAVRAVQDADKQRHPATAAIGTVLAPELLADSRQPIVKHDELVTIRFQDPKTQRTTGLLVQWNCHPEDLGSRNTEISADFVAGTVRHLQKTHDCPVMYCTGAVGGLMSSLRLEVRDTNGQLLKSGTFARTDRYGVLVAEAATASLRSAQPITLTPFQIRTQHVLVPVQNGLYRLAWQVGTLKRSLYQWDNQPTPKTFTKTQDATKPVAIRTEVGYLRLGTLDVAVIPGELYPELLYG